MKTIPSESNKERVTTMSKLTRGELKSAVIGMVIGNGSLYFNGKNASFQMNHCTKQLEYMKWKAKILNQVAKCKIHRNDKRTSNKIYGSYHLYSLANPLYTGLYKRFYQIPGKRSLDEYLVKKITPLALSIIYMDDGTVSSPSIYNIVNKQDSFFLRLCNFDYANLLLLKKSLKIKFDLEWNIVKHNPGKRLSNKYGMYWQLRLRNKNNDKFISIIKPYVEQVPCMLYKLGSYANASEKM